jgi:hypothetical protein
MTCQTPETSASHDAPEPEKQSDNTADAPWARDFSVYGLTARLFAEHTREATTHAKEEVAALALRKMADEQSRDQQPPSEN